MMQERDQGPVQAVQQELGGEGDVSDLERAALDPPLDEALELERQRVQSVAVAHPDLVEKHLVQLALRHVEVDGGSEERLEPGALVALAVVERSGEIDERRGVASLEARDQVLLRVEVQVDRALRDAARSATSATVIEVNPFSTITEAAASSSCSRRTSGG